MKKSLKITAITLLSLLGVVLISASILVWIVFTPGKLTPIVQKYANEFLLCQTRLDKADLTFFSTFPYFGLHLENVALIKPMDESPSDTLAYVSDLTATLNVKTFLTENKVILNKFYLKNVFLNAFVDSLGNANFSIVEPSPEEPQDTTPFENPFDLISLESIDIEQIKVLYTDRQSKISAQADNFGLNLNGQISRNLDGSGKLKVYAENLGFLMKDSTEMSGFLKKINLKLNGEKNGELLSGDLDLNLPKLTFALAGETLANEIDVNLSALPFAFDFSAMKLSLQKAKIALNEFEISLGGWAQMHDDGAISTDLDFATGFWQIKPLLSLVPKSYAQMLSDIDIDGRFSLSGKAVGVMKDEQMPQIFADLNLSNSVAKYADFPYTFSDLNAILSAKLDLSKDSISSAKITSLRAKTGKSNFAVYGVVDDLLNSLKCNLNLKARLNLPEFTPMLPDSLNVAMTGFAEPNFNARFKLDDVLNLNLEKILVNGTLNFSDLDLIYNDSIFVKTPKLALGLKLPSANKNQTFKELLQANVKFDELNAKMVGLLDASISQTDLTVGVSDFRDTLKMLSADCDFSFGKLNLTMDTISAEIENPKGKLVMTPAAGNPKNPAVKISYSSSALSASMGKAISLTTKALSLGAKASYDETQKDIILQWNPELNVDLNHALAKISDLTHEIQIPAIKFDFTSGKFQINNSNIIIGNSDFSLYGLITNIDAFLEKTGLLTANLDFVSKHTDVSELMDLVSGAGQDSSPTTAETSAKNEVAQDGGDPFMVPLGVDVRFNTKIQTVTYEGTQFENVGGLLTIKDGVLILEQMGFTSDAANMQLTAMYRSPRKNHLFAGIDFHLLNIEIDKLIKIVPDIDTIVPMLSSFAGRAEFHLAAETYLKSNYDIKFSTLRGAAAIEGKDLKLLDSETFSTISKYLMFNKKTENKIDSIGVEMTIFRDEVDLYPFLISMDKYQAIINGRYNLTPNYDCHIALVSPLRLDLDVKGNMDDMKFNLFKKGEYTNLFKPEKRNVVEERTMSLKKLISDALKSTVKEVE